MAAIQSKYTAILTRSRRYEALRRAITRRAVMVGALTMFGLLTVIYIASVDIRATRGAPITGDEPFYLLTTQSLLQDRDLDLRQQYGRRSYESFFNHPVGLWQQSVSRNDGILLSPHNPGLSILLVPGFAIGGLVGAQVQMLLLAALTFALVYVLTARVTNDAFWSWVATGVVALSASAFIYATEIYPEVPAALMVVVSLLLVHGQARIGVWGMLGLLACLSALPWLGIKYVPLAGLVAAFALWRMGPHGRTVFLAAGSFSAALFVWFHLQTFGALTPYSVGAVYAGDSTLSVVGQHLGFTERAYRLVGLFIDQRFGIARWAPVFLLLGPGMVLLWRNSANGRLVFALIVTQLLIATFIAITMMGWWFPGRTLMTVLPLFALPLALLLLRMSSWGKLGFGVLAVLTLMVTAALTAAVRAGEVTIAVDPFEMEAAVFQLFTPLFPNYTYWDTTTWLLTIGWLIALLGSLALTAWLTLKTKASTTGTGLSQGCSGHH